MKNGFFKGHGLGNDYIALNPAELDFRLTPANIRAVCDRHWGVGSDGILALEDSRRADFAVRIYNPDGSEAEKSGNGLRIFGRYLYATRKTRKRRFRALWIQRINAAARLHGLTYGRFINGLARAGVEIDRKVIADLAVREPEAFKALAEKARAALA